MTDSCYHIPVLLKESIDGLNIQPDGVYVDVTFGGGGHSRELLSRLGPDGHLYSFDQDADAELNIRGIGEEGKEQNMEQDARLTISTDCLPTWACRAIISMTRPAGSRFASMPR